MGMMDTVMGSLSGGGSNVIWMVLLIVVVGGLALVLAGGGWAFWYFKKKWNLKVEIKLPRSDGKIINGEWGKGFYDTKRGVVFIKRPGVGVFGKATPMQPFDVRKYLQGTDLLTVVQAAPNDYRPVLNDSWVSYIDDKTGEEAAVITIKIDSGLNKSWLSSFTASAKNAYSLKSILTQFQTPIAIGIVILCCFVGFAIMWTRIGSIC